MSKDNPKSDESEKAERTPSPAERIADLLLDDAVFQRLDSIKKDNYISKDEILGISSSTDPEVQSWIKEKFGSVELLKKVADNLDQIKSLNIELILFGTPGASKEDFRVLKARSSTLEEEMALASQIKPTIAATYRQIAGHASELSESRLRTAANSDSFSPEQKRVFQYILDNKHKILESSRNNGNLTTSYVLPERDYLNGKDEVQGKLKFHMRGLELKYQVVKDLNK